MALVRYGSITGKTAVRTRAPRIRIDDTGLVTLTEEYRIDESELLNEAPGIGVAHPDFGILVTRQVELFYLRAGLAGWIATYQGPQSTSPLPANVWRVDVATSLEDIRAHPDFDALLTAAGAAGVTRDENGLFLAFNEDEESTGEQLRGVQQFFAPTVTATLTAWSSAAPSGGQQVGKINSPTSAPAFVNNQRTGDQNWLKIGFEIERYSDFYQRRETWMRSGDRGWSELIYG